MGIPFRSYWRLLRRYLQPQRGRVFLLAVLLLAHIGLRLLNPQIVRYFIDAAVNNASGSDLLNAALLYIGLAVLIQALAIFNTYFSERVAWDATNALRLDLLEHCLGLDQSFHKEHSPGELLERIDGDVNNLANFFSRFVIYLLGNALFMLGILVLLLRENPVIGLGITGFVAISLVIMLRIRRVAVPSWEKVRQLSAEFFGQMGENLSSLVDLKANGALGFLLHRFDALHQRWYRRQLRANLTGGALWGTNTLIFNLGLALALILSGYYFTIGLITIGTAYLIIHYSELLQTPLAQLRNQIEDLQRAEASIGRVRQLQSIESRLPDNGTVAIPAGPIAVRCQSLSFAYELGDDVLRQITFDLPPGRVLGLLGRTGSGKTTLARLLVRFYDPTGGTLTVNGVPPHAVPLIQLRQRVSLVTQDVQIFQATIRDNLTLFNPGPDDATLHGVLTELGLGDWLARQPDGLNTRLSAGGQGVSAGQAQLLALARAFLQDPDLVILDEASARLDPATENLIETAIDRLLHRRTGVIIAHRLATVERADDILILEKGLIREYGARAALAADPASHFARLLQTGLKEVLA